MRKLFDFAFSVVLIVFVGNASAITDTFDVGGGAVIPLPPGEWHVLQDSNSDWGNGRRLVLGAKDVSSEIPLLAFAYTQSGQRWSNDPECFSYFGTNKVPYVALYGSKPGALKQKCAIIWGSSDSFSQTQTRLLNRGNRWWTEANPGLSKGAFTGGYSETEIHLRDFGRRNFSMNIFVRNPSRKYAGGNYREVEASYEKWLTVYVDALQKAFQEKLSPKKIAAFDFYRNDVSASMDKAELELAEKKLLAQERLAPEQKAQAERRSVAETSKKLAAAPELTVASEQGKSLSELLAVATKEGSRPAESIFIPVTDKGELTSDLATGETTLSKVSPNTLAAAVLPSKLENQALAKLNEARIAAEAQAKQQTAAQELFEQERLAVENRAKKQLVAQQQVEQDRLALAKQKELMASELAAMRTMFAELKKANEEAAKAEQVAVTPPVVKKPSKPVVMARRRALVIGNERYESVPVLENAAEDARAMASALSDLGYKVDTHLNLTERGFERALRDFRADLKGGEEVLFFYAGHGVQLGSSNFLLPTDVRSDSAEQVKDDSIELQKVLDDLSDQKVKFALAVIDACRDNPFKQNGRAIGGRGLAPTTAATGQMVMFSAGSGQQALDKLGEKDKGKNGLFTRVFLEEMKQPGVSVDRVLRNVRQRVVDLARSVGHEQVPALYDQAVGDFYFLPK